MAIGDVDLRLDGHRTIAMIQSRRDTLRSRQR
jgi:hypothetical protein